MKKYEKKFQLSKFILLLAMVLVYSENVKELCLKNDEFMFFGHILRNSVIPYATPSLS